MKEFRGEGDGGVQRGGGIEGWRELKDGGVQRGEMKDGGGVQRGGGKKSVGQREN